MARKLGIYQAVSRSNPDTWAYEGQAIYHVEDIPCEGMTEPRARITFADGATLDVDPDQDIVPVRPLGVYRPRQAVSMSEIIHDGQRFYTRNLIDETLFEVQFSDGEWLLCEAQDLIEFAAV